MNKNVGAEHDMHGFIDNWVERPPATIATYHQLHAAYDLLRE